MDISAKIEVADPHIKFRQMAYPHLIALAAFCGLAVGSFLWNSFGDLPTGVFIPLCFFSILLGFHALSTLRKALTPSNWLLIMDRDTVSIKFRSYLNSHFPETDPQVIRIPQGEIDSARITKQKITQYSGLNSSRQTSYHTFLDLNLRERDLSPLQEQLKKERNTKAPQTGRFIKSRSKAMHYPVSVAGPDTIRIEWRSPHDQIQPGIKKVIELFSRNGIKIEPLSKEVLDMTLTSSEKAELEDRILFLAQRGETIAAIKLVRKAMGMNLTDAKKFVEELIQ